jgi:hypothetical protein
MIPVWRFWSSFRQASRLRGHWVLAKARAKVVTVRLRYKPKLSILRKFYLLLINGAWREQGRDSSSSTNINRANHRPNRSCTSRLLLGLARVDPVCALITDGDNATHGLRQRFIRMELTTTHCSRPMLPKLPPRPPVRRPNTVRRRMSGQGPTVMQRGQSWKGLSNVAY